MLLEAGQVAFAGYQDVRSADDIQVSCRQVIRGQSHPDDDDFRVIRAVCFRSDMSGHS